DGDGDMDLFIGGRMLPQKYPQSPRSYFLQNDHGKFTDITKNICRPLEMPGLITGAVFTDINNDKKPDLIICGEWMPVRFFVNEKDSFREVTDQTVLAKMNGQWRTVTASDLDKDGDVDIIAGNLGRNNKWRVSADRPMQLYAGDFDGNSSTDIIPSYYIKNNQGSYELFPALDRAQLADQIPSVKKTFLLHMDYARTTMKGLLGSFETREMVEKECQTTVSIWIENLGNGKFEIHDLPVEAQFAPINCVEASDMDGDNNLDILIAGNEYQNELTTGPYDASYGLFLKGNGKGSFKPIAASKSGFILDGDIKCLKTIRNSKNEKFILAAVNDNRLRCFKVNKQE
ncbi:MAG TPA: VCBS repeat-containing protein, partial [Chitinophagaceae bacterium]|nr:VCBS repeat-containing protein [Chitinophagaceae bacterium]